MAKSLPMKLFTLIISIILLNLLSPADSFAMREWDSNNNPDALPHSDEKNFQALPLSGAVAQTPWADYYWPHQKGGAAYRWQGGDIPQSYPQYFGFFAQDAIADMSDAQLATLSAAEKYDILQGKFDYPLATAQRNLTSAQAHWSGYCHAVAVAATNFREPQTLVKQIVVNGVTKNLTFYSSDVKALLALAMDKVLEKGNYFGIGARCESGVLSESGACWDSNPASFYLALTNLVGRKKMSMIIDVDATKEVWNAALVSYKAQVTPQSEIYTTAAPGTVRQVKVDLSVKQMIGEKPNRNAVGSKTKTQDYSFTLELDANDNIIGGEWLTTARPDMIWLLPNAESPSGYFSTLNEMVHHN